MVVPLPELPCIVESEWCLDAMLPVVECFQFRVRLFDCAGRIIPTKSRLLFLPWPDRPIGIAIDSSRNAYRFCRRKPDMAGVKTLKGRRVVQWTAHLL